MLNSINNIRTAKLWNQGHLLDGMVNISLILLVAVGIFYRLNWVNWSKDTNLHPDEYGLTNTLTQLSFPKSISEYFNTRLSPLSPYQKYDINGQVSMDGPDNRMRWGQWPMILIRGMAELTGNTGYGELRLMGRTLSALADTLSLMLIFSIGRRLFNRRISLLAAALSALAVMQIQQSHFMTVDNFSGLFSTAAMYACVRIAQRPCAVRPALPENQPIIKSYRIDPAAWVWFLLFGVFFGMTVASKINLLPVGGMVLLAAVISIADLKLKTRHDLTRILLILGDLPADPTDEFSSRQRGYGCLHSGAQPGLVRQHESGPVRVQRDWRRAARRTMGAAPDPYFPPGEHHAVGHGASVGHHGLDQRVMGCLAVRPHPKGLARPPPAPGVGGRICPVHGYPLGDVCPLFLAHLPVLVPVCRLGIG
jgi:hypothetical protein